MKFLTVANRSRQASKLEGDEQSEGGDASPVTSPVTQCSSAVSLFLVKTLKEGDIRGGGGKSQLKPHTLNSKLFPLNKFLEMRLATGPCPLSTDLAKD